MGTVLGIIFILVGIALVVIPGLGRSVIKFQNDIRGAETKEDTTSAGCLYASVWIGVGIWFLIAL